MSLQSHTISGFVGGDPESREVHIEGRDPQEVTTMSVAVNNPRKPDADPTWYRVSMWNGLGKVVEQYVQKGSYVVVSASRLTASAWTDQEGNPRATLELTADAVDFSANRRGNGNGDNAPEDTKDIPF